jgi:ABC-2 type transport system ATP-binding protein
MFWQLTRGGLRAMLSIEHLSKTFVGDVKALDDVSLQIPKGMFGLLGPNGAGKSTLMRIIATLLVPDSGNVRLDGIDCLRDKDALRARLGYLPQDFGTYPRVTPEEMLEHLAVLKGVADRSERRALVDDLLEATNLTDLRKRRIDTFSGGMKQRFGVAQALIGDPALIIVDEPTAGLDPAERRRFHNLLSHIGRDVVVILSTHIVEDVSDLCPRMAILGAGRILLEGEPQALVEELDGRLWERAVDENELDAVREVNEVVSTQLRAGRTMVRVLADRSPGTSFGLAEPSLEDVYFATLAEHGVPMTF